MTDEIIEPFGKKIAATALIISKKLGYPNNELYIINTMPAGMV